MYVLVERESFSWRDEDGRVEEEHIFMIRKLQEEGKRKNYMFLQMAVKASPVTFVFFFTFRKPSSPTPLPFPSLENHFKDDLEKVNVFRSIRPFFPLFEIMTEIRYGAGSKDLQSKE